MNISDLLVLAQAAPPAPQSQGFLMIPYFLFIIVIFYFMMIRPQQKKAKDHQKLIESVKTGDQVVTNAGIHGTVSNVKDKTIIVKVADNVKIEFDRAAVVTVEKSDSPAV